MPAQDSRVLTFSVSIPANISAVWEAWTTSQGVQSFLAPECKIELKPGGAYEMYFDLDAPFGSRGGEGCTVLAVDAPHMLSFTWNAPPELPHIRSHYTHVIVTLVEMGEGGTRVRLTHDGWGTSGEWDEGIEYFRKAWGGIVLPRLRQRFVSGPIRWED